ncbi:hypothetical protein FC50_GL000992 [Lacticaseibacillus pantheris DSM 15945 = JCM 12539 = NBRC 106106]|uniref:Uncharacterized protein n=1 Tax=Lacticaseibacillus pantheris DSM 15945 = JCM 12539 = NBRC 106106 TaxID=1423783 RepID=A0A0R1U170_9LACO|nr:hypothetical protein [Lacticaseibacillus pantheris]KRL86244.1 hypothetical protein FC50_GL000992 [Lacticaseibacillus pantheris DSM 15945 = JCM 12539 = NBRC 106106]
MAVLAAGSAVGYCDFVDRSTVAAASGWPYYRGAPHTPQFTVPAYAAATPHPTN